MNRRRLMAVPSRDELIREGLGIFINQRLAEAVIDGRIIHNVETGQACPPEAATEEFRTEAAAAYYRFLVAREGGSA